MKNLHLPAHIILLQMAIACACALFFFTTDIAKLYPTVSPIIALGIGGAVFLVTSGIYFAIRR